MHPGIAWLGAYLSPLTRNTCAGHGPVYSYNIFRNVATPIRNEGLSTGRLPKAYCMARSTPCRPWLGTCVEATGRCIPSACSETLHRRSTTKGSLRVGCRMHRGSACPCRECRCLQKRSLQTPEALLLSRDCTVSSPRVRWYPLLSRCTCLRPPLASPLHHSCSRKRTVGPVIIEFR